MTPARTLRGHKGGIARVCDSQGVSVRRGWREPGRAEPSFSDFTQAKQNQEKVGKGEIEDQKVLQ